ncbi:hypothetical protein [Pedobacter montanisoli]|uniref:Uncharacterized protein n=1 Tax=Pedobacter montanisoli TaxID=2923277 RepID=A0ABS9ZUL8_9SPHI|nr:hypothetical protein [Pedobacter montanisoli]MCJ0742218.1 hypothetical protein [Pedobacter montanisoli]
MPKTPLTDQQLAGLIKKSLIEAPSKDFDDNVMYHIKKEAQKARSLTNNAKISLVFFILGTGFGLLVSHLLPMLGDTVAGIDVKTLVLVFQICYVILILTQLEHIIKLFSRKTENN